MSHPLDEATDLAMAGRPEIARRGHVDLCHVRPRFEGATAFLCLAGPTLAQAPLDELHSRGCFVVAVNNAATVVRPNLWLCNDSPERFHDCIWTDPAIEKWVPFAHAEKPLRVEKDGRITRAPLRVIDAPNVQLFRRRKHFDPATFLLSPAAQIGCKRGVPCALKIQGVRSVMFPALRILCQLGFRRIVLVGADFAMTTTKPYAFDEVRNKGEVHHNNAAYAIIGQRLKALRPILDALKIHVVNATPGSGLDAFPRVDLTTELDAVRAPFRRETVTRGWYTPKNRVALRESRR